MSKDKDRFSASLEFGARLRELRLRAGLTQSGLAEAAGCGWPHTMVSKLEAGDYPNPGLGLVADYLRACRASFEDLSELLNEYTSRPLPAELKARKAVVKVAARLPAPVATQVLKYDVKTTVARRAAAQPPLSTQERVKRVLNLAAAASRRKRLDIVVASVVGEPDIASNPRVARFVDRFARKVWGVLSRTRTASDYQRTRLMARLIGDGAVERVLPAERLRLVRDCVAELFTALERSGAFARMPERTPRKPKPYVLAQDARIAAGIAREASIATGLSDAIDLLQARGRRVENWNAWHLWLQQLGGGVYDTLPGTPERERVVSEALKQWPESADARHLLMFS